MLGLIFSITSFQLSNKVLPGMNAPLGFFDPLKLSHNVTEQRFKFYQEAEIKHGRLAMLASIGFPIAEQYHPLWGGEIDVPSYIAFQASPLQIFWYDVILFISIFEVFSVFTFNNPFKGFEPWSMKDSHCPGDLHFDPLNLQPTDSEELFTMKTREINNGRVAMGAIVIMVIQEFITKEKLF
jgi:light-harvesting complex I chlorophyll a/b binding protein 4